MAATELRIGIVGLGAIGLEVARRLDRGIPGLALVAVAGRDPSKTAAAVASFRAPPAVLGLTELSGRVDAVVDCAPSGAFRQIADATLAAGRTLVTVNAAALLAHEDLLDRARRGQGRIVVATGALLALDAVAAAAEGEIKSVRMITRKPPAGLRGAPHLVANGISVEALTQPLKVFDGSAREAARGFPANVNVAAALSLAGIGPDRTRVEVWADPAETRNVQRFEVEADSSRFAVTIENVPSADNPRTGRITPLSVVATLRRMVAPVRIGT